MFTIRLFAGKPSGFSGGRLEAELCTVVTTNGRHDDKGVNESGKRCQWSTKFHLMSVRPRAAGPAPAGTEGPRAETSMEPRFVLLPFTGKAAGGAGGWLGAERCVLVSTDQRWIESGDVTG